jgi:hypothetical protein
MYPSGWVRRFPWHTKGSTVLGRDHLVTATLVYGLFTISKMRELAKQSSLRFGSKSGVNARNCSKQPFPACIYTASALAWGSLWHCLSREESLTGMQSRQ